MKKLVLLSILFLFVAAVSFSENRPPGDTDKIELSFDQPSAEVIADYVFTNPVVETGVYFSDAEGALINGFIQTNYIDIMSTVIEEWSGGDYSNSILCNYDTYRINATVTLINYNHYFDYSYNKLL